MNIFIINLVTLITCDCFSTNHQNVTIFHRTQSDDIHNGHAKPSESEQQSSSAWRIINKKSESRSNKYFVTWRPDLWEEENKNNLSIISSHQHKHQDFQPQFYFSHKKQTQTSQPFFNESLTSLNAPPETSTARPPPTSTVWSYSPVFNTIFSVKPKYKPTFLPSTRATAAALRLKSTTTTVTTSTSTSTTTTTTTGTTTSSRRRTTSATIVQTEILKPFQSNLPLEDEETIVQSPTTFLAYIRFIIITVLRFVVNTLNGQMDQHSGTIMENEIYGSTSSFLFSTKEVATIVGFPLLTGLMLLGGAPVSVVLVTAWLTPLLSLLSLH